MALLGHMGIVDGELIIPTVGILVIIFRRHMTRVEFCDSTVVGQDIKGITDDLEHVPLARPCVVICHCQDDQTHRNR